MSSTLPPKLYACLSYNDPRAAVEFLERAFGFAPLMVVPDEDGSITHAELSVGGEIIMLGSSKPELGWVSPLSLSARNATVCMALPGNVDEQFARAVAAGATVVRAPYDTSYGAREFSVRDPEGHEWHLGTYRPTVADS